jgi:molybdenum cofactor cytidylyltransferase
LVVLGHRSEEIAAELAGSGTEVIRNPRYEEGMLTSVQAGVAAASADTDWFLIALGDQPSLRPATVERLLHAASEGDATILVPSYGGRRGHPLLIHASHREEIGGLDGGLGLRELLLRHPESVRHLVVPEEAVLHDMDTPEDYQRELRRLEREARGPEGTPAPEEGEDS